MEGRRLLIVDDDEDVSSTLNLTLQKEGYQTAEAYTVEEALQKVQEFEPQVVLLDIRMPSDQESMQVLKDVKRTDANIEVILLTALYELPLAVDAMRLGAFNYLTKPWDTDVLKSVVERAFYVQEMQEKLRKAADLHSIFSEIADAVTHGSDFQVISTLIASKVVEVIPCEICYLLIGERGEQPEPTLYIRTAQMKQEILGKPLTAADLGFTQPIHEDEIQLLTDFDRGKLARLLDDSELVSKIESLITIPLKIAGETIGYIIVYLAERFPYLEEARPVLKQLAFLAAMVIHFVRLLEEVKDKTERLIIAEKEAELAQLLGGLFHFLAPKLIPLEEYIKAEKKAKSLQIVRLLRKMADDLKRLVRGAVVEPILENCNVEKLLDESLAEQIELLKENHVKVVRSYKVGRQRPLSLDQNKMRDVFSELILNAVDAIKLQQPSDGGELTIETEFDESQNRILISFQDNGCGVAEEDAEDIFKGFVTSKGNGTGLGLPTCLRIVQSHGGELRLDQTVKRGAKFVIELPVDFKEVIENGE